MAFALTLAASGEEARLRGFRSGHGRRAASLWARFGLWLAALALLSQSLAATASHMPTPAGARAAARELVALLGPGVVVCTQSSTDPDRHQADCRDQCPLCLATVVGLEAPAPAAPARRLAGTVAAAPPTRSVPPLRAAFSFARGPPALT
jgi:hypothetical protein